MVSYLLSTEPGRFENSEPLALGNKATREGRLNDYYGYLAVTLSYLFIPEYKFNVSRKAEFTAPNSSNYRNIRVKNLFYQFHATLFVKEPVYLFGLKVPSMRIRNLLLHSY